MEQKQCNRCKEWKLLEEFNKQKAGKYGRRSECKECQKERNKRWRKNNPDYGKQYRQDNAEHIKEYKKQWYQANPDYNKQWYKENGKEYFEDNKEKFHQRDKKYRDIIKENNLQFISNIVEQVRPIFKELNLPIYGYIYKFENIKTRKVYIGQTIQPLYRRYRGGIVKGWIKDRLEKVNQKFKEELIEEDIEVTEVLDVACCPYHLNIAEAYWINYYDSFNNGYNNNAGCYDDNNGKEEFIEISKQHNAEFVNGQIIKKTNTY